MKLDKLDDTIRNSQWLAENREELLQLFPETWTHFTNVNQLALRYKLKLLGVDYRTEPQLAECLAKFEQSRILLRDGMLVRRGT